jgi:protein tyrosine/serine phosphatase
MARNLGRLFGIVLVVLFIGGPVALALHQQAQRRNFRVVREGVLYRSGQTTLDGFKRIVHDYGIRTVISLRDSRVAGEAPPDKDEEAFCGALGIKFLRLPPAHWEGPGDVAPVDDNVRQFRAALADPANHPVLVHCFRGWHRTGAYCAIYRMEFEGWSNERAIHELRGNGYTILDDHLDLLNYLEHYQPTWRAKETESPATLGDN